MPRTRRVDCSAPGLRRVRRGKGFSYHEEDGTRVTDADVIERISALAIPPAWDDVWICSDPRGHVQATGIDAAGRKQYRYHDDWRAHRDRQKFDRMLDFARRLPKLRARIESGLAGRGLSFDRVCATAVALLDLGLFRIGSERYEDENNSYGLTTLKVRHVSFSRGGAEFEYPAKSGQLASHQVSDPVVIPVLKALARRGKPDDDLLTYRDGRSWADLGPDQVNDWIKETIGEDFSAKDFRTWNATVLAALALAFDGPPPETKTARRRRINEAVKGVAFFLGNTPAVCRKSYIDPRVIDRFEDGETIGPAVRRRRPASDVFDARTQRTIERAVIRLIED
jgi:DNA topoisomerase I